MHHEHIWKPSPSQSSRVLLMLHGTGGDENSLLDLAEALDPQANVLSVRGNVREGSANRFFRRLAEGVFDLDDLNRRTDDLAEDISDLTVRYGFDRQQVIAVGFSNGANIAASLLLRRWEAIGSALLIRSMTPYEPTSSPNLVGKRVLMLNGDRDPLVPVPNAQHLERIFRTYGAEVKFDLLQAGHEFTRRDLDLAIEWLATFV